MNPKFPIYIPSKSRWDSKLTMICLDTLKVPYKVIVEEEQFKQYADSIGEDKLLILPKKYQDEYQTFDDFCAFLQKKTATQRMKGGNTSELYSKVGTFPKSVILAKMHPDVCKVVWRWGRYHHYIDYKKHFRQKLIFKDDIELKNEINNYGMKLIKIDRANKINTIKRGKHANN